jgi:glycosyltransferase involved in cell wall biosynthesis
MGDARTPIMTEPPSNSENAIRSPMVSVAMISFNQERFIREALESVLTQDVPFEIEIVIGDDASTDSTPRLIREILEPAPVRANIIERKQNIGYQRNFLDVVSQCRGKYIAILEGDDLWTSKSKLADQVRALEGSNELSGCVHDGVVFETTPSAGKRFCNGEQSRLIDLRVVLGAWVAPTASIMFVRELLSPLPEWFSKVKSIDYALLLTIADRGKLMYLPIVACGYRKHQNGVSSRETKETWFENMAKIYIFFAAHSRCDERCRVNLHGIRLLSELATIRLRSRNFSKAAICMKSAVSCVRSVEGGTRMGLAGLLLGLTRSGSGRSSFPYLVIR